MVCGKTNDQNCRNEFQNAKRNNDLDSFYKRCRTESGANPMRKTCSLCCNKGNNLIRKTKSSATNFTRNVVIEYTNFLLLQL